MVSFMEHFAGMLNPEDMCASYTMITFYLLYFKF